MRINLKNIVSTVAYIRVRNSSKWFRWKIS